MRPIRVMLVDDDPSARFLLRTILADHPADFELVAETGNAQEAEALLRETAPQVALLDARMPIVDGFELAARLREVDPEVRLVLLSAHVDAEVRSRADAAGIDVCLDKGAFDEVPRAIRDLVSPGPGASAAPGSPGPG